MKLSEVVPWGPSLAEYQLLFNLSEADAELRIFPLLALDCQTSIHIAPVEAYFRAEGYTVEICKVPYEFQKGGGR